MLRSFRINSFSIQENIDSLKCVCYFGTNEVTNFEFEQEIKVFVSENYLFDEFNLFQTASRK